MSSTLWRVAAPAVAPRLGFLGVGWIGRQRMAALASSGAGVVAAIADGSAAALREAAALVPGARVAASLDELLDAGVDGIVIATPSALHADHATAALERGSAVFCQKPLARTTAEARRVIAAARSVDRLLGVDLSYRHVAGMRRIRERVRAGALGRVHAVDLVFHNAYGPDRPWFRDPRLAGGGCVIDLGIHLVDLALWCLDFPAVASVRSRLYAGGRLLGGDPDVVEDHATAEVTLHDGATIRLACSWNLHAGQDAVIGIELYGDEGGAALRNVNGSFYDFVADEFHGTSRVSLASPPDAWGGRALVEWTRQLARDGGYDAACETNIVVASILDRIYGR
jgi:predicted dehydrogenase